MYRPPAAGRESNQPNSTMTFTVALSGRTHSGRHLCRLCPLPSHVGPPPDLRLAASPGSPAGKPCKFPEARHHLAAAHTPRPPRPSRRVAAQNEGAAADHEGRPPILGREAARRPSSRRRHESEHDHDHDPHDHVVMIAEPSAVTAVIACWGGTGARPRGAAGPRARR
jgi:hypothetical protein